MKTTNERALTIALLTLGSALLVPCLSQAVPAGPSGQWTNTVSNPTNLVWDMAAAYDLTNVDSVISDKVEVQYPVEFTATGTGKVIGSGSTTVNVGYDDGSGWTTVSPFTGAYKVSGSIASSRGIAHGFLSTSVSGIANMAGASRKVSSTDRVQFTFNNVAGTCTGVRKAVASASGLGSQASQESFTNTISNVIAGDGSWTLVLTLSTTNNTLVTGTGVVTLNSGRTFDYTAKGKYNATKQQANIVLTGNKDDTLSKGSVLQVNMSTNVVRSVKGKIAGQIVNVVF